MSYVAGIDVSSYAVDVVLLDEDGGYPIWRRYELHGADAWERTRDVPRFGSWTDDVLAFGVENPQARGPAAQNIAVLHRVVGAVLVQLPRQTLVHPWQPAAWRKACGLAGNAKKADVRTWVRSRVAEAESWSQDAADAYCLALATLRAVTMVEAEERDGSVSSIG